MVQAEAAEIENGRARRGKLEKKKARALASVYTKMRHAQLTSQPEIYRYKKYIVCARSRVKKVCVTQ